MIDTDLKGLKGRVTSVLDDGRVDMQPTDPGLEVLTFEAKQLRKHFEVHSLQYHHYIMRYCHASLSPCSV